MKLPQPRLSETNGVVVHIIEQEVDMHATTTIKHWMHHLHDSTAKVAHLTGHMLHEKNFWGIVAILAMIAGLFALIMLHGGHAPLRYYATPQIYPYY